MQSDISLPELIEQTAEGFFGNTAPRPERLPDFTSTEGAGPTPLETLVGPQDYTALFEDAARAKALSIITDPDLHFTLYGRQQGRALLARIPANVKRVVMIAPSYLKQCGIGEYGRYLSSILKKQMAQIEVVRTSSAALDLGKDFLDGALVLVNHGPGLFDGLNPRLSQGESTTRLLQNLDRLAREMGAIPMIIHHSLLDTDHDLLFSRQQQILNSDIPSIAFISSAGRHFFIPTVELGVSPVTLPETPDPQAEGSIEAADDDAAHGKKKKKKKGAARYPKGPYIPNRDERPEVVGFFGFFQYGGKDFDSLFHLVRELRGKLVGSVATGNSDELHRFHETLATLDLPHDLGSGWIEDTELLARLMEADYFYLPQNDYDHWNNSATARFVTNLDRPLFLPPHHPFLDMADGSIFAAKEDLPRIVAHFREEGHFDKAVDRVRAFRARADMAHTATAICTEMLTRTAAVGRELLETAPALSAERFAELPHEAHPAFTAAVGAPESADLETLLPHLPALYRAPAPRQYWRKHYELGDLIHSTLLETIHTAYIACAKRHIRFEELIGLLSSTLNAEGVPLWPFAETARATILRALEDKGGLFYDPEIVLLDNGQAAGDWQALLAPAHIDAFLRDKTARRDRIQQAAAKAPMAQPEITNLAELLLIPADILRQRSAPFDLSALDLNAVQAMRQPASRMNRLVAQANAAGLRLGDHLVFDHLQVPEVAPRLTEYALEDFIFFSGDMFVLNAVRRIDKRNPFPLEMMVLNSMLNTLGMAEVLRHLLIRAEDRVRIVNFDDNRDLETEAGQFLRFMDAARDPLFGLIEPRNAYEVQKRHNGRWWLANKEACDALWYECGSDMGLLTLLYARLSETAAERADPAQRRGNPAWQMDMQGRFRRLADSDGNGLRLRPGQAITVGPSVAGAFGGASLGFYPVEEAGAWSRGTEGSVLIRLDPAALEADQHRTLRLRMGFFGSSSFDDPRTLTLTLTPASLSALPLFEQDEAAPSPLLSARHDITGDTDIEVDLDLSVLDTAGLYALRFEVDHVTSPAELGWSPDDRVLGVLLKSLTLAPATPLKTEARSTEAT